MTSSTLKSDPKGNVVINLQTLLDKYQADLSLTTLTFRLFSLLNPLLRAVLFYQSKRSQKVMVS